MPSALQPIYFKKALAISAVTQTTTLALANLPVADYYSFYLTINTNGTTSLNVGYLTSVDKGTTYLPIPLSHTQITTTTVTDILTCRLGLGFAEAASVSGIMSNAGLASVTNKNAIFDPYYMEALLTVSGTTWSGAIWVGCYSRFSEIP